MVKLKKEHSEIKTLHSPKSADNNGNTERKTKSSVTASSTPSQFQLSRCSDAGLRNSPHPNSEASATPDSASVPAVGDETPPSVDAAPLPLRTIPRPSNNFTPRSAKLTSIVEDRETATCLFNDERIRIFYAEIKSLLNDCFHSLYDTVLKTYTDPAEQQKRYLKGLLFVAYEMNTSANSSEIYRVTHTYPLIAKNYQRAMSRFAQYVIPQRYLHAGDIKCPSLESFLYQLYRRVALSSELKSMRYFHMNYTEQEIFLKDILRIAMNSCLDPGHTSRADPPYGQTPLRTTSSSPLLLLQNEPAEDFVMPQDSVSNIHLLNRTNAQVPAPNRAPPPVPPASIQNPSVLLSDKLFGPRAANDTFRAKLDSSQTTKLAFTPHADPDPHSDDESLSVFLKSRNTKRDRRTKLNLVSPPPPACSPDPLSSRPPSATTSVPVTKTKEIDLEIYSTPFNAVSIGRLRTTPSSQTSSTTDASHAQVSRTRSVQHVTSHQGDDDVYGVSACNSSKKSDTLSLLDSTLASDDDAGENNKSSRSTSRQSTLSASRIRRRVTEPKSRVSAQNADDEFMFFKESVARWETRSNVSKPPHPNVPPSEIVF